MNLLLKLGVPLLGTPFQRGSCLLLSEQQISEELVEGVGWRALQKTSGQVAVSQYNFLTVLHMDAPACPYL